MLKWIQLNQFRNYKSFRAEFGDAVNIFIGQNGQGKTNLLESIHLLATGESFRYCDNENLIQQGTSECLIRALVNSDQLEYELKLQISKSRKNLLVNSKRVSFSETNRFVSCVVFSPESLSAIKEGADLRRRLIDELVVSLNPNHQNLIKDFRKALKSRNRVLKDFLDGKSSQQNTQNLLDALNPSFFRLASFLTKARIDAIHAVELEYSNAMQGISRNSKQAQINYFASSMKLNGFSHQDIHSLIEKRALELRSAELATGTSLVGPQKHDVIFIYDENDSRFYASQGQQRALILSFKMAQIVYHRRAHGREPLLLLDDVLSELDEEKRGALILFLQQIKAQIFMTTTDLKMTGDLASHDCRVFELKDSSCT